MTEEQRELVFRYMAARTIFPGKQEPVRENPELLLQELNESLGFNIKLQPDKVAFILEEAIRSEDATDIEIALHLAGVAGFQPAFMPLFIEMLELPWHYSHENLVSWLQHLKAPEPVEALYRTALVEHEYQFYVDGFPLARRCTWALADIGTEEAHSRLQQLAQSENLTIAAYAQKRIDNWQAEKSRKGAP